MRVLSVLSTDSGVRGLRAQGELVYSVPLDISFLFLPLFLFLLLILLILFLLSSLVVPL